MMLGMSLYEGGQGEYVGGGVDAESAEVSWLCGKLDGGANGL